MDFQIIFFVLNSKGGKFLLALWFNVNWDHQKKRKDQLFVSELEEIEYWSRSKSKRRN